MQKAKRRHVIEWWNKLFYIDKFELIVKHKELIVGYPVRNPDSLTGDEIEKLYDLENK